MHSATQHPTSLPARRFNPNLFKGSFFSTGGYSAQYERALQWRWQQPHWTCRCASGRPQPDGLGGGYTQTLTGRQNALTASVNYYNLSPYQSLIRQNFDWERPAGIRKFRSGEMGQCHAKVVKDTCGYFHSEGNRMTIWQKIPGSDSGATVCGFGTSMLTATSRSGIRTGTDGYFMAEWLIPQPGRIAAEPRPASTGYRPRSRQDRGAVRNYSPAGIFFQKMAWNGMSKITRKH